MAQPAPPPSAVVESGNLLGESPVWDAARQALWWVDIHGRSLHRWTSATGHGAWPLAEQVGCIALHAAGGLVCGTRTGFASLDGKGGLQTLAPQPLAGRRDLRFNDGRADRRGAFWSGTVQERRVEGEAALYRLAPDGTCVQVFGGLTVVNGIAFSPDGRTLYFADSHVREIYAAVLDPVTGIASERRVFARFDDAWGLPDGATVDAHGFLWVAGINGGRLLRFRPDGALDRTIALPVSQPTSCTFGGPGLATLYVTSARRGLDDAALRREPLAGSVFALDVGVAGLPEPAYGDVPP